MKRDWDDVKGHIIDDLIDFWPMTVLSIGMIVLLVFGICKLC